MMHGMKEDKIMKWIEQARFNLGSSSKEGLLHKELIHLRTETTISKHGKRGIQAEDAWES